VVSPPVARWANSPGLSYLVESTRRCEREAALGLYTLRTEVLRALHLGRDAPSPGRHILFPIHPRLAP